MKMNTWKSKMFGVLVVLALIMCVFATMTPVALADEPPMPGLYDELNVPEDAMADQPPEPEQISEDTPEAVAISEDAPQIEPISTETQSAAQTLPLWAWIVIAVCAAMAIVLTSASLVKGRRK